MAEDGKRPPVSGEIMTEGPAAASRAARTPDEIAEAEFEVLDRAVRAEARSAKPLKQPGGARLLVLQPHRERARPGNAVLFWGLVACVMLLAFWAAGGHATVPWHKLPLEPTAQALLIENVVSRVETGGARDVLFVDGDARNRGSTARPLPAIAVAVTDNEGMTTRYLIGPHVPELRPGGSVAFSSRLEAPRSGVRTVSVAFEE